MSDVKFLNFMKKEYPKVKDDSKEWKMLQKAFTLGAVASRLTVDMLKDQPQGTIITNEDGDEYEVICVYRDTVFLYPKSSLDEIGDDYDCFYELESDMCNLTIYNNNDLKGFSLK